MAMEIETKDEVTAAMDEEAMETNVSPAKPGNSFPQVMVKNRKW